MSPHLNSVWRVLIGQEDIYMYADSFFASQAYANYCSILLQHNEKLTEDDQTQGSEGSTDDR